MLSAQIFVWQHALETRLGTLGWRLRIGSTLRFLSLISNQECLIASQERAAKPKSEQKAQRFVAKLKALDIDRDEV